MKEEIKLKRICKYCKTEHQKGEVWWDEFVCYKCKTKEEPNPTYNSGTYDTRKELGDDESNTWQY